MSKFKIEIIINTNCKEYYQLENLIKEFAINVFIARNKNLDKNKLEYIKNYEKNLSEQELEKLEIDICDRIKLAKELINNKEKNKVTRFYIVKADEEVIGFQTAQVRNEQNVTEGWRNYAYIKPEFVGKIEFVEDVYGIIKKGNISNLIYENITQWFQENNVTIERTATGKNMYKNILTYIVVKGFTLERFDDERVYLIKEYNNIKSKKELKKIYKEYKDGVKYE